MRIHTKGFTLMEIVIVIAIIVAILAVFIPNLSSFRDDQALKNTTESVVSILNQARTQTLSSQNSMNYSVRFENNKAILFSGTVYDSSDVNNKTANFDESVSLPVSNISLNTGATAVTFDRLTGDTNQYGTITIELLSDTTKKKIININKLGIISAN
jgi:prepilin-type N-terminal cleavage/methylation domain-containing protein